MTRKHILILIAVLLCLLVLAYGLKIDQRGYLVDDWLTLFVVENQGPASLVESFSIDRPLRGYFDKYMKILLGTNMLYYQVTGLAFRLFDTLFFFAILMVLFPKRFRDNLLAAMLALIYPGFLQQLHAFDYHAHFASHLAMTASFLVCILPIYFQKKWLNLLAIPISIGLFQASVWMMELNIGMDLWRYYLIYMALRYTSGEKAPRLRTLFLYSLPYIVSTSVFFVWRLFFFESKRATVDSAGMLQNLVSVKGILEFLGSLAQNLYRLVVAAWYQPVSIYARELGADDLLPMILISVIGSIIVVGLYLENRAAAETADPSRKSYALQLIAGGLIFALGSIMPIVFGGREIVFANTWNRFTFPGMMGSVLVVIGMLNYFRLEVKYIIMLILVLTSLTVHYGNANVFARHYEAVRNSWWQFSWRVPDILPKTTVMGKMEDGHLIESPTIWAPLNIIYYPDRKYVIAGAEVLTDQTKEWVFEKAVVPQVKRMNGWENHFGQVLIFSYSTGSCMQIIDGQHPEISQSSDPLIAEVAPYSQIEMINPASEKEITLNPEIFGPEPEHEWCYLYQQAQLARQVRDWEAVANLGGQALEAGFNTEDKIEWLVFIQGLAYTRSGQFSPALENILGDEYVKAQACEVYSTYTEEMASAGYQPEHQELTAARLFNDIRRRQHSAIPRRLA
jgi:hypothetical protein